MLPLETETRRPDLEPEEHFVLAPSARSVVSLAFFCELIRQPVSLPVNSHRIKFTMFSLKCCERVPVQ